MSEPDSPDPDSDAEEADAAIADLVSRIRRADDPTAALLRPLSAGERRAMADRVIASLDRPRAPARRKVITWAAPLAAALAMAAAILIWARSGPSLPEYRLDVEGDALVRGEDAGAPLSEVRLRPKTKLRVKLAPMAPARDAALRVIVVRDGHASVISPPALSDGQGGFTIEEAAGKLLGAQVDGPIELVFAIGKPLPDDEALAAIAKDRSAAPPRGVRLVRRAAVLSGFSVKQGALGFAGCKAVRAGPICEVGRDTHIHVWMEGGDAGRLSLRVDGREVGSAPAAVEGGLRFRVDPPRGARALTLSLAESEVLRLPLEEVVEAPLVEEAEAKRREGKLDEAEALLAEASRDPAARFAALRVRAKIAHKRGDFVRAAALREEAITEGRARGRVSDQVDDQIARVFELLYQENAIAEAKRRLEAIDPVDARDAEDRVKIEYFRGLVAGEAGSLRASLASLRAARLDARRFAVASYERASAAPLADALSGLGRYDEAAAILAEMERDLAGEGDLCQRAQAVMDHGAVLLRAGKIDEAARRLTEAARFVESGCPRLVAGVATNLAFARREAGAIAEARELLSRARAARAGKDAWIDVWQERLGLEIALEGDARAALAAAEKVRRAAEAVLSPELLFEAELGRARALEKIGDAPAATRAYGAAEHALDAWGSLVPLGEGRSSFLARQERAALTFLDFLRREASRGGADPAAKEALARAARRSVGRFYRAIDAVDLAGALAADRGHTASLAAYRAARARIDASLAGGKDPAQGDLATVRDQQSRAAPVDTTEPLAPRAGELALIYHPLPEGWLGVAWTREGVVARSLGHVDPAAGSAALAGALLDPFRDRIARASVVRLLPHRALAGVALHALPWEGGSLLDRAPVVYGVDLPAPPAPAGGCAGAPAALIVADARLDLSAASAGAGAIAAALAARGYEVRRFQGDAARVEAVERALVDPCVRLFHYEGHAVFQGRDGIDAALLLADGRLRAVDVLRLPRVPEAAVLSGCSTAEAEGLGLAHAFLARGATRVLATTTPVADATAAKVAQALYAPPSAAGEIPPRLAEGWQSVHARLRGGSPDLDAYRVLAR